MVAKGQLNEPPSLSPWNERPVHLAQEPGRAGPNCGSPRCGNEEIFLSFPGFEHYPSAAALVVSCCINESFHATFGILAAVKLKFRVFWDSRHAEW